MLMCQWLPTVRQCHSVNCGLDTTPDTSEELRYFLEVTKTLS
ncbi:hypothetical protein MC7420_3955 [Coleofasciculus chthonoplastes PCC 7420]|uniref:Uncharacterized protein n=1 Tax=Coleofasciculus chthonoplastes PCC 7420 TaxID=118168 RepID=B4VUP1_9CYAN|nr:hypothetical protein MC7420_3955 [Coleofasciculus chthonoplastes PCC 7420]